MEQQRKQNRSTIPIVDFSARKLYFCTLLACRGRGYVKVFAIWYNEMNIGYIHN